MIMFYKSLLTGLILVLSVPALAQKSQSCDHCPEVSSYRKLGGFFWNSENELNINELVKPKFYVSGFPIKILPATCFSEKSPNFKFSQKIYVGEVFNDDSAFSSSRIIAMAYDADKTDQEIIDLVMTPHSAQTYVSGSTCRQFSNVLDIELSSSLANLITIHHNYDIPVKMSFMKNGNILGFYKSPGRGKQFYCYIDAKLL